VHLDPTVVIRGSQGGPDVGGTATVTRTRIASLAAAGGPPGGTLRAEVVSPAGDVFLLVASLPADPFLHPAGWVFVDPTLITPLVRGTKGPGEHFPVAVPVPPLPELRGAAIALQAANLYQARQQTGFSNDEQAGRRTRWHWFRVLADGAGVADHS